MAAPPASRGSSLDHTPRPAPAESTPAFRRSATSVSIPKSDFLRHALEARRAQNTPVQNAPRPAAINTLLQRSIAPAPSAPHTPAASPDAFDEFDLPEEIMTPESPIRKRWAHEKDTPPRGKTNQELSAEVERLRNELINRSLRVELLKKSNQELQAKWLQAKEEVDQLKPLEDENYELRVENKKLKEKLAAVQDDMDHIEEISEELEKLQLDNEAAEKANHALRDEVVNLTEVNKEAVTDIQKTVEACHEAVEMIASLEDEKMHLKTEVDDLKQRVAAIESKQVDGSECPRRIHSIDEHRPATSYDDSDYYSQPATPRAGVDKDALSVHSATSVRSKRFIELTKERTRLACSLSKRMSDASLKAANLVFPGHVPEVPHIPEEYAQLTLGTIDERFKERICCLEPGLEQLVARSDVDLRWPTSVDSRRTRHSSGLRSSYGPDQPQEPSTSQSSTSHVPNQIKSSRPRNRTHSVVDNGPVPPPRMSSRHARTTSDDVLQSQTSDGTLSSNTASGTLIGSEEREQKQEQVLAAWASMNPRTSTVSLLTSPRIDRPDKERWWKDTENVRPLRARATMRTLRTDHFSEEEDLGLRTFAARAEGIRTSPTTPAAEKAEEDFLFNPRENEDQFMRKAITRLKGSMRR